MDGNGNEVHSRVPVMDETGMKSIPGTREWTRTGMKSIPGSREWTVIPAIIFR